MARGAFARAIRAVLVLGLILALSGCGGTHYTEAIRSEYEDYVQEETVGYISGVADDGSDILCELYAPDGVTHVGRGRFVYGGSVLAYVYDVDRSILYCSRTKAGFSLLDAKAFVLDEINGYLSGSNVRADEVRSLSWLIPYTEYQYTVTSTDGEKKVSNPDAPKSVAGWMHCPYFRWTDSNESAEAYVSDIVHGPADGVSSLTVVLRCHSLDDVDVDRELSGHGVMNSFSGIETVLIYGDDTDDRYWMEERQEDGSILVTYSERKPSSSGKGRWTHVKKSVDSPFAVGEDEESLLQKP